MFAYQVGVGGFTGERFQANIEGPESIEPGL